MLGQIERQYPQFNIRLPRLLANRILAAIPLVACTSIFSWFISTHILPWNGLMRRLRSLISSQQSYDFGSTLERYSGELATLRDQESVTNLLLDGLYESLNLTGIAFVALPDGLDAEVLSLIEVGDLRARGTYVSVQEQKIILSGLTALDLSKSAFSQKEPLIVRPWAGCAALLIIGSAASNTGSLGLLVIGPKRNGDALRSEERRLLSTLGHQAATALSNAVLLAGLQTSLEQVKLSTAQLVAARSEQQLLLRKLVDADERQRAALAHDLHDDALQEVLYLIRHSHQSLDMVKQLESDPVSPPLMQGVQQETLLTQRRQIFERLRLELTKMSERSVVVEQRLRALYLGLYPALLNSLGLRAALEDVVMEFSANTSLAIRFECSEETATIATKLEPETALHVYRITQEGLRNISKHAQASWARVHLFMSKPADQAASQKRHPTVLHLIIEDNGIGLPFPLDFITLLGEGHLGLAGMRERTERIGGMLHFGPRPDGGTTITLDAPITLS